MPTKARATSQQGTTALRLPRTMEVDLDSESIVSSSSATKNANSMQKRAMDMADADQLLNAHLREGVVGVWIRLI